MATNPSPIDTGREKKKKKKLELDTLPAGCVIPNAPIQRRQSQYPCPFLSRQKLSDNREKHLPDTHTHTHTNTQFLQCCVAASAHREGTTRWSPLKRNVRKQAGTHSAGIKREKKKGGKEERVSTRKRKENRKHGKEKEETRCRFWGLGPRHGEQDETARHQTPTKTPRLGTCNIPKNPWGGGKLKKVEINSHSPGSSPLQLRSKPTIFGVAFRTTSWQILHDIAGHRKIEHDSGPAWAGPVQLAALELAASVS